MKAIKKPIPIEVEEFQPDNRQWPHGVDKGDDGHYFVFNSLHKSAIRLEAGDFVNVTDLNDLYPIKRAIFYATYDVVK